MIGVLGGTYDPVHHGHLRLALEVLEALGLSEIRLIPLNRPNHRPPPVAPGESRLAMLHAATAGEPRLKVDDRELRRGGISYTVETLQSLREELGNQPICLILGMDAFSGLTAWHQWRRLPELAHLVVACRPGAQSLLAAGVNDLPRTDSPAALRARAHGLVLFHDLPHLDISASRIRALVEAGRSVRYLLPEPVLNLIEHHRLYR